MRGRRVLVDAAFVQRLLRGGTDERTRFEDLLCEYEAGATVLFRHADAIATADDRAADVLAVAVTLRPTRDTRRAAGVLLADDPTLTPVEAEEIVLVQRHRIDETAGQRGP